MHRLVGDELFQQQRRRAPRDAAQFEESHVEPVGQDALEVRLQPAQRRLVAGHAQQFGAHVDHELHTVRQRVELGEKSNARGLQRLTQTVLRLAAVGRVGRSRQGGRGGIDRVAIDVEFLGEHLEEAQAPRLFQGEVGTAEGGRAGARRHLAAPPFQAGAHVLADGRDVGIGKVRAIWLMVPP